MVPLSHLRRRIRILNAHDSGIRYGTKAFKGHVVLFIYLFIFISSWPMAKQMKPSPVPARSGLTVGAPPSS
jgi:hypothetical protein